MTKLPYFAMVFVALGLLVSSGAGPATPLPPEQSIDLLLQRTIEANAPNLVITSGAPVVAAIEGRTVRGDSWKLNGGLSCALHESYVVSSSLFPLRSNADHPAGTASTSPIDWIIWAQKHGIVERRRVNFYTRGFEGVRTFSGIASKTPSFQECRVIAETPSAVSTKIPIVGVDAAVLSLRPTATHGSVTTYEARFTATFEPLYPDIVVQPAELIGTAHIDVARAHEARLVDYTTDQSTNDGGAISITYLP